MIKKDLIEKASEVKLPDEMISKMMNRIENKGGNHNMLKDRIHNTMMKKWVVVSICGILATTAMMYTFSEKAWALALDAVGTIKTIFVLEKSGKEYKIVEKSATDPLISPTYVRTSKLSDEEISKKLGFTVTFPEKLYGEYKHRDKGEGVGIQSQISEEMMRQLESVMIDAIDDDTAFNGLSEYKPYRFAFANYIDNKNHHICISIHDAEASVPIENYSTVVKTKIGNKDAIWTEMIFPDYEHIMENGVGRSNLFQKPESIVKMNYLIWESNGVRYTINDVKGQELLMKEAVKIAESFMK